MRGKVDADEYQLGIGEDNISSYEWNWKQRHHKFCKTCGSSLMIDFRLPVWGEGDAKTDPRKDIIAVNVSFPFVARTGVV